MIRTQSVSSVIILLFFMGMTVFTFLPSTEAQIQEDVEYSEIPQLSVRVDDDPLSLEDSPKIISGRIMLPVRPVFESLGAELEWNGTEGLIYGIRDDTRVVMSPGQSEAIINGDREQLSVAPEIIDGRTYIPFRFAGEVFGGYVEYMGEQDRVNIIMEKEQLDLQPDETQDTSEETPPVQRPEVPNRPDLPEIP